MNDIRYSELLFLRDLAKGTNTVFHDQGGAKAKAIGLSPNIYTELAATMIEEHYAQFDKEEVQLIAGKLRGEGSSPAASYIFDHTDFMNPRETIIKILSGIHTRGLQGIRITYRGLRRIEELRDMLRRDRILEPFGVLLDKRYFLPDLHDALRRSEDIPVSVIYADMDNFKVINTKYGHAGGDVVMEGYLKAIHEGIGNFGTAYRGLGDETASLILGQDHKRVVQIAERIRENVTAMNLNYKGEKLPKVTASLGVASTPPAARTADIETLADSRNNQAKETGKNRVVAD